MLSEDIDFAAVAHSEEVRKNLSHAIKAAMGIADVALARQYDCNYVERGSVQYEDCSLCALKGEQSKLKPESLPVLCDSFVYPCHILWTCWQPAAHTSRFDFGQTQAPVPWD